MFEKIGLLVIGWLLGLLGPLIVDRARRDRDNEMGRVAILSELRDVGRILAIAAYGVKSKEGSIDREFLEWLKSQLEKPHALEKDTAMVERLNTFLAWTDKEIAERFMYMAREDGKAGMLQKYPVPLLDSRVSALWSFDTDFQRRLLDIKLRMHRLDDMVERQRKLHDLTFSKLEEENREAVKDNIRENAAFYAKNCILVVNLIANLPDK